MEAWEVWEQAPISESPARPGSSPSAADKRAPGPDVRSRWCAKETAFNTSDAFVAATPPLEATKTILGEAASQGSRPHYELKPKPLDAEKVHLRAPGARPVYVHLPPRRTWPSYCSHPKRCLNVARDAPKQWEASPGG